MDLQTFGDNWLEAPSDVYGSALPPPSQPSLWESFAAPWASTAGTMREGLPTIVGGVSQTLRDVLLQRAGLINRPVPQNSETVLIHADRPGPGVPPPSPTVITMPSPTPGLSTVLPVTSNGKSSLPMSLIMLGGIALIALLFMRK